MNPPSTSHIPGVDPVSTVSQRPADTPSPQAGIRAPVTLRSSELSVTCRPRRLVSADWSRPIAVGAGSVLARMSRYGPAVPGTLAPQTRSAPVRTGTSRHCPIRFIKINRIQERTLNPRVRGSSPWRRTRSEQALYVPALTFLRAGGTRVGPVWDQPRIEHHRPSVRFFRLMLEARLSCRVGVVRVPQVG